MILDKLPNVMENEEMARTTFGSNEVSLVKHSRRNIVTIDSVFMTEESKRWTNMTSDGHEDVVYSSIVKPENLQKTIDLYKRLNIIPRDRVTVFEGEEFYDCDLRPKRSASLKHIQSLESVGHANDMKKVNEKKVKKNAFYSSKYLILDSKEKKDIPKFLQTRSWSYTHGMETPKEDLKRDPSRSLETLESDELVEKWLKDHSDDMAGIRRAAGREKHKNVDTAEASKIESKMQEERGANFTEKVVSTVNSVIMGTLFPSEVENNLSEENGESEKSDISPTHKNASAEKTNTSNEKIDSVTLNEEQGGARECDKIQDVQNNLEPGEDKQNKNVVNAKPECPAIIIEEVQELEIKNDEIQDVKHEGEAENPTALNDSNSRCDNTPLESIIPIQDKKILTPPDYFLSDIETDDKFVANPQKTSEMDIQKHPEAFLKNLLTTEELGDKNPQLSNPDNKTQNDSEANAEFLTFSDLLAFRAERDKSENKSDKDQITKANESKLLTGNPQQKLSYLAIAEAEDNSESFI